MLEKALPAAKLDLLNRIAGAAGRLGSRVFLVGGAVRDLLLGISGFDLDLSVEGDAIDLAHSLAADGNITVHHRFNTATLFLDRHQLDLARSREETYPRPGALPSIRPSSIEADLRRRDFSVNAMALSLNLQDRGRLIDTQGGYADLERKLIRVLHAESFKDDPTRIWRAVRYEQRLDFTIEPLTMTQLKKYTGCLSTITADRQRYELECVLREDHPEKVFRRAAELGLLPMWHPALAGDDWLIEAFHQAQRLFCRPSPELYLALLGWRLSAAEKKQLTAALRLTKIQGRALKDSQKVREALPELSSRDTPPSRVYRLLHGLDGTALEAGLIASESIAARQNLARYKEEWHRVTPYLSGQDLKRLGVPQGPEIKALLDELRYRRLDSMTSCREDEEALIRQRLQKTAD